MAEIYEKFMKKPKEIFERIIKIYGKDAVYENIEYCGGFKVTSKRSKTIVAIPVDSCDKETSKIFLEINTDIESYNYNFPMFWKGKKIGHRSWHPMDVPEDERSRLEKSLLGNLEKLELELAKRNK